MPAKKSTRKKSHPSRFPPLRTGARPIRTRSTAVSSGHRRETLVENLAAGKPGYLHLPRVFPSGMTYQVEIRDLASRSFSCTCPDFRCNGLGTCKHVEATLYSVESAARRASSAPRENRSAAHRPRPCRRLLAVERNLDRVVVFASAALHVRPATEFDATGIARRGCPCLRIVAKLRRNGKVRISQDVAPFLEARRRAGRTLASRRDYEQASSKAATRARHALPLYPYQREGMLPPRLRRTRAARR